MAPSRVRIPPSPLAQRPPRFCAVRRRGGRAVECGGLENRYPSLGGSRVQIPPPPFVSHPTLDRCEEGSKRKPPKPRPGFVWEERGGRRGCGGRRHAQRPLRSTRRTPFGAVGGSRKTAARRPPEPERPYDVQVWLRIPL